MAEVFLSYSRADRELANAIIRGLRAVGVSVWWDEDMHSIDWNKELERQIVELATIAVLWTPNSVESDNVKDEARLGLESNKVINILNGVSKPPYPFDRVNGLPLEGWTVGEPHNGWTRLVHSIEEKVVQQGAATRGEYTGALTRHEEARAQKVHNLARAQEALDEAQAREAETTEAAQVAHTAYARAEEQHVRVLEMRATHLILSAATQEFETARSAKEDADRAMRAAKAEVKGAQREVALAKAALESDSDHPRAKAKAAPKIGAEKTASAAMPAKQEKPPSAPAPVAAAARQDAPTPPAAPKSAPTPAPVAAAASAAPAPAVTAPSAGSTSRNLIIGGAAVIIAAGAGAGLMLLSRHSSAPAVTTPAVAIPAVATRASAPAAAAAAHATPGPAPADPKAAAIKAAASMAGKWAPEGLTCDSPIVIAIKDGDISMNVQGANSTAAIQANPKAGEVDALAEDGGKYVYQLSNNDLSMIDPHGQAMKMTRCGG